jgi:uncharacterized protein (DUF934 family)
MRKILQQRELVADPWRYPGEEGDAPQLLTLAEAASAGGSLPAGSGVLVAPGEDLARLLPLLPKVATVVLRFEKGGEGRGFSQAQQLRLQAGFGGTIRAAGPAIKRDLLFLLARCGFDAFEFAEGEDPVAASAHLERFSVAYQPASDRLVQPRQRA